MPAAAQMRGFERCVWFVVLFVTGDVRPPTPRELAAAKDVVAMVDAGDLSGLPPRLSPAARRELSMERLSSQAAQLHDTYGSARGVRELIAGHNHATFAVVAERGEWQLFVALTDEGEIDELRPEPAVNAASESFVGDGNRNEGYFGYGRDLVVMEDEDWPGLETFAGVRR